MSARIEIQHGRIIDPANNLDAVGSIYIKSGKILALFEAPNGFIADTIIDAKNKIVCPGFIDLSVRLREPGYSYKATISSETKAAASAGITSICVPPDSCKPVIDTPAVVELIKDKAEIANYTQVYPIGALSQRLAGKELSAMFALKQSGCVAVSNASQPLENLVILRRAMEYAASHDLTVFYRPNEAALSYQGCVHEGHFATKYGLPAIPEAAESIAVAECLELAELTGCRIHFSQLSSKRAVIKIHQAQKYGLKVSADVAMHQLHLSEDDIEIFNSAYHVQPPLRSVADKNYLQEGVLNGTIAVICSDHQPHDFDAKLGAFPETEAGISALETLLPLSLKLVAEQKISLTDVIACLTCKPAQILGINSGNLALGSAADICIFDPTLEWLCNHENWLSAGNNTPFWGNTLVGRVTHTLQAGKLIYSLENL